ncbi:acylphosphatase [Neptunomonas antarctica]|uniref:Acylphosphatase n=1 Tax=Neptunomonas antarctica TaxID=619304 RepID=A0A1N7JXW3_9GAMM|nr:acylphosphatase [Neptunomonas antarctica]SIS54044.1 acylphosphatase [Neptunomonas antarctica]
MTKICINAHVSGSVQGVWFRKSTQDVALSHGLTGWVRNLPDGRVEVMMCGEGNAVRQVEAWLYKGPELANVVDVHSEQLVYENVHEGFVINDDADC